MKSRGSLKPGAPLQQTPQARTLLTNDVLAQHWALPRRAYGWDLLPCPKHHVARSLRCKKAAEIEKNATPAMDYCGQGAMLKKELPLLGHLLLRWGCAGMPAPRSAAFPQQAPGRATLLPSRQPPSTPLHTRFGQSSKETFSAGKKKNKNVVPSKSKHFMKTSVDAADIAY